MSADYVQLKKIFMKKEISFIYFFGNALVCEFNILSSPSFQEGIESICELVCFLAHSNHSVRIQSPVAVFVGYFSTSVDFKLASRQKYFKKRPEKRLPEENGEEH